MNITSEPWYYSLNALSQKTGVSVEQLWLHAEQGDLKLSINVNNARLLLSRSGFVYSDDVKVGHIPADSQIIENFKGSLQVRTKAIVRLHKYNRRSTKDNNFYCQHDVFQFAQYMGEHRRNIFRKRLVILKEHVHEFQRFLNDPNVKVKQVYLQNRPFQKTNALYKDLFELYVTRRSSGLPTNPADIQAELHNLIGNSCIQHVDKTTLTWQSPTDAANKTIKRATIDNHISRWNQHFEDLKL